MPRQIPLTFGALLLCATSLAAQSSWSASRPDGLPPVGVMLAQTLAKGEVLLSYRYLWTRQEGTRTGLDDVTTEDVLATYAVAPLDADLRTHVLEVAVAPAGFLTLDVTVPIHLRSMSLTSQVVNATTESSGIGDVTVDALLTAVRWGRQSLHFSAGLSLPTGAIGAVDTIAGPTGLVEATLPYSMQVGAGVVGFRPAVTYLGQNASASWGLQVRYDTYFGTNDRGYRPGGDAMLNVWLAGKWAPWISSSVRVAGTSHRDVQGADTALDPTVSPLNDPTLQWGNHVRGVVGTNLYLPSGPLRGNRLAVEFTWPLYQNLDGPQLRDKWAVAAGWQATFGLFK